MYGRCSTGDSQELLTTSSISVVRDKEAAYAIQSVREVISTILEEGKKRFASKTSSITLFWGSNKRIWWIQCCFRNWKTNYPHPWRCSGVRWHSRISTWRSSTVFFMRPSESCFLVEYPCGIHPKPLPKYSETMFILWQSQPSDSRLHSVQIIEYRRSVKGDAYDEFMSILRGIASSTSQVEGIAV